MPALDLTASTTVTKGAISVISPRISNAITSKTAPSFGHSDTKCSSKQVDAHIKPFRCGRRECERLPGFSSHACLRRHEREMHNQQESLCLFENCERSRHGHGFPRPYNASDHMKRVHGYRAQEPAKTSDLVTPSSPVRNNNRKGRRRTSDRTARQTRRLRKQAKRDVPK